LGKTGCYWKPVRINIIKNNSLNKYHQEQLSVR
jgi:hypothetical protein